MTSPSSTTNSGQADAKDWAAETEARVLAAASPLAPALGWTTGLVKAAARSAGLSDADATLLLPDGPRDLAALLFRKHDAEALTALSAFDPSALKVRERIRKAVEARIEAAMADEAMVRKAGAFLALPPNLPLALSLGWASADRLWRWAGDTATDENHYSKRAILGAVLATTMATRLSRGRAAAESHLDARIGDVMAFETWKAGLPTPSAWVKDAVGRLGALRYGRSHSAAASAPGSDSSSGAPPSTNGRPRSL